MTSRNNLNENYKIHYKKVITVCCIVFTILSTLFGKTLLDPLVKYSYLCIIDGQAYYLESSIDNQSREKGLMFRKSIPENTGMLFIFEQERYLSFWMHNTFIPLDIIFLNKEFQIINIYSNTTPLNDFILYQSTSPAKYTIEIPSTNTPHANQKSIVELIPLTRKN